MEKEKIKNIVLKLNRYLKEKYNADIVFGGSFGFYLQGIDLGRKFHDIDVRVVGIDPKMLRKQEIDFDIPVHFLGNTEVPLEAKELGVDGEKILVYTIQTIINCKKHTIWFNEHRKIKNEFTERKNKKDMRDLEYIKEKYGIEI